MYENDGEKKGSYENTQSKQTAVSEAFLDQFHRLSFNKDKGKREKRDGNMNAYMK